MSEASKIVWREFECDRIRSVVGEIFERNERAIKVLLPDGRTLELPLGVVIKIESAPHRTGPPYAFGPGGA